MCSFRFYTSLLFTTFFWLSCSTTQSVTKKYTEDDKKIFELIDRMNKNPNDEEAKKLFPQLYESVVNSRKNIAVPDNATKGDSYVAQAHEWEVLKQIYNAIIASPATKQIIPDPLDPSVQIQNAYNNAAEAYYQQGVVYMDSDTRTNAQKAYDYFVKADKAVPGYRDVQYLMTEAKNKSLVIVLVNPVNYYNNSFGYWGFQNDWIKTSWFVILTSGLTVM